MATQPGKPSQSWGARSEGGEGAECAEHVDGTRRVGCSCAQTQQGTERQPFSGWFLHSTYRDVCECLLRGLARGSAHKGGQLYRQDTI